MDNIGSDDEGEVIIDKAEIVAMPRNVDTQAIVYTMKKSVPESSTPANEVQQPTRDDEPESQAVQESTAETNLVSDTATIRSFRSGRSARSGRSVRPGEPSRASIVSAAKRRSTRTSMGSLRLPKKHASLGHNTQWDPKTPPPVPDLPKAYQPPSSFLFFDDDSNSPTTIDGIQVSSGAKYPLPPMTVDDLQLGPRGGRRHTSEDILMVSRSLTSLRPVALDDIDLLARTRQPQGTLFCQHPSIDILFIDHCIPQVSLTRRPRSIPAFHQCGSMSTPVRQKHQWH